MKKNSDGLFDNWFPGGGDCRRCHLVFYSGIQSMRPEMPVELREARVVLGSELFKKINLLNWKRAAKNQKELAVLKT